MMSELMLQNSAKVTLQKTYFFHSRHQI